MTSFDSKDWEIEAEIGALDLMLQKRFVPPGGPPALPLERERILIECIADLRIRLAKLELQLASQK